MTKNVTIRIDDRLWKKFKIQAKKDGLRLDIAVVKLFSEALKIANEPGEDK